MKEYIRHYTPCGPRLFIDFSAEGKGGPLSYRRKLLIRDAIEETLFHERIFFDSEVSVTLCDNAHIRMLNREYREKDAATDVLSFPMYEADELPKGGDADGETVTLGDIVLSVERAAEQAAELGHSTEREIAFLCIHSTLHRLGYDHERGEEEDEDMCRRQREILLKMGLGE